MIRHLVRAGSAMLMVAAAMPAAAQEQRFPAIATGLAIPAGPSSTARSAIPARGRSIVVDAASARLFMTARIDVVIFLVIVGLMVWKPGAG